MDDPVRPQQSQPVDARESRGVQIVQPDGSGVQHNYYGGRRSVSWPHLVGVIPPRADGFQDRAAARVLDGQAAPGRTAVLTQVVSGLGGVGKTQLAAAFARRLWVSGELDLLVWVSAASREAVVTGYAQTSTDLVLGPDGENPDHAATRFLAWLESTDSRWLIVMDDLSTAADVRGLWPPDRQTGRTVVTTRRRDSTLLAGRNLVEVGMFTKQEAIDYLTGKLPARLADDTSGVAVDLGLLPLALAHTAAYMIDQDLACTEYRRRFAERHRRLTGLFPDESALFDGTTATVATTWALSIDAANACTPAGFARPLLDVASVLDPNGIPEAVFVTDAARGYVARQPAAAEPHQSHESQISATDVRDGLRCLHRFNLVTHDTALIRVHALVQRAVRDDLPQQQVVAVAEAAADALVQIWPNIDRDPEHTQLLRANAAALHRNQPDALWKSSEGAHPVLLRTARSLGDAAMLADAIHFTRELSEQAVVYLGTEHADTLTVRNQLAKWLGDAGDLTDAVPSLERLVVDATHVLGPDHPSTLDARRNLGYQRGHVGDLSGAVVELAGVLADQSRVLGPDDTATLTTANHLAYWRGKAGDAVGAVAALRELAAKVEQVLGPDDRATLDVRGNLASWRGAAGDPVGAAAALQVLLDDVVRVLGPDHRDVSGVRNNLAYWRGQAGDPAGAAAALQELLADRLRMFGPDHRDTLATRHSLACLRGELGDPAAAAAALEQVLADRLQVLGPEHPATMSTRSDLAHWRGQVGLNDSARHQGPPAGGRSN